MAEKTTGTPVSTRQRLPWSLILIFLLLVSGIAVSGYFYYQNQKKKVLRDQNVQLQAIADLKANEISRWLGDRMADVRLMAQDPERAAILSAFIRDRSNALRRESAQRWLTSVQVVLRYENVLLLDRQGDVVLAATPKHILVGKEGLQALATARRLRDSVLSDLHSNPQVPHLHLDLVAPLIFGEDIAGFVFLRIDPSDYLYPMIQAWPTPSPSAETLLVRREGDDVLFLNELRHRQDTAMKLRFPISTGSLPAAQAILGKTGAFSGNDYRGIAVWSVIRPVEGTSWYIVAKVDRDEIEQPIRRNALMVFLFVLSLILVTAILVLYLWQRQNTLSRLSRFEALRESEDKFKYVFDKSMVGKSITLPNGEINVNQAFCAMLGYTAEELKSRKWQELTPVGDIENTQKALDTVLSGEKNSVRFEKRYLHKNGHVVWADVSTALRRDAQGKPLYFMTSVLDISERKRAETALRASEKRLRETQAMARLGHWSWDITTGAVEWSEEVYRIFHLDPHSFTPRIDSILALSPWPEDHERDKELIQRAMATHEKGTYEQRFLRPDGSTGYYHSTFQGNYDEAGKLISIVGTVLDISKRKRAEIDLQAISARNQALLEAVPDIIMEVDANKVYTWANHAGTEFFGADVISHEAAFYFEGEQQVYQTVKPIFNGSKDIVYVESWQRRRDGEKRLLAWWCRVLKDAAGNVSGALSSARDITEIKLAENEIHRLNTELEQRVVQRTAQLEAANKELEAFSYSVSHDLRAPLRAISGFTQILLEEYAPKLDKEGRRLLDIITGNTGKMGQLIDDLLAFSRLSRQQMAAAAVDLTVLAKVVFAELHNAEKDRHIEFKVGDLPRARGDHSMLQQVLQNLLANAIKFTRTRKPARIEFGGRAEQTETVYFVKDNGVGFDMAYVKKLFGVFQRLHSADEFEGTGVGLAIVQRIVQRHGGRAWAEGSTSGATFYFSLPTATAPRAAEKRKTR